MPDAPIAQAVRPIEPTRENAELVQRLTLQDLIAGGFPNPTAIADPEDPSKVEAQLKKLHLNQESYKGYYIDDKLVAYLKQGLWRPADELPFVTGRRMIRYGMYRMFDMAGRNKHWGVFGLVALGEPELGRSHRDAAFRSLLWSAHSDAYASGALTVSIVIHSDDPVQPVAVREGYRVSGRSAEVANVPGIKQLRYRRSL